MALELTLAETVINAQAYADGDRVDAAFRRIRAEAPLDVAELEGFDPFWVVSRHADIKDIERQPDLFHNGDRSTFMSSRENEAKVKALTGGDPNLIRSLVSLDGQEHKDLRGILFPHLTPRAIRPLEEQVREKSHKDSPHRSCRPTKGKHSRRRRMASATSRLSSGRSA